MSGQQGNKIIKQTEADKDANQPGAVGDPWSTERSADERMNYAEKYYGFTITAEERGFFRSLDKREANAREAAEKGAAPSSKKRSAPTKKGKKDSVSEKADTDGVDATKKPPRKKRPLQDKVNFISTLEDVLDEDGDVVPRGQKGGDAYNDYQRAMAESLDNTLDRIISDRAQEQQLASMAAMAAAVLTRQQNAFEKPPDFVDVVPETQPSALYHPYGISSSLVKPDQSVDDPHVHVPVTILESLQQVQEYDTIEIEFMQPLMRGEFEHQMNGSGLDLCECIDWIEGHLGLDFWRALVYHADPPGSSAPPTSYKPRSLDSLFLTEEDDTPWYATWIQDAVLQQLKMPSHTSLPALDHAVIALDFILDQKSHFLIRFVYLTSALAKPDHSVFTSTLLGSPFLTPISAFSTALKALDVPDPGSLQIVDRAKALQVTTHTYDYNNFGASSDDSHQRKRPLSLLKGAFAGYYYHIPKELKTQRDDHTHATIHREFVFTS